MCSELLVRAFTRRLEIRLKCSRTDTPAYGGRVSGKANTALVDSPEKKMDSQLRRGQLIRCPDLVEAGFFQNDGRRGLTKQRLPRQPAHLISDRETIRPDTCFAKFPPREQLFRRNVISMRTFMPCVVAIGRRGLLHVAYSAFLPVRETYILPNGVST